MAVNNVGRWRNRNGWKISIIGEAKEEKNIGKAQSDSSN